MDLRYGRLRGHLRAATWPADLMTGRYGYGSGWRLTSGRTYLCCRGTSGAYTASRGEKERVGPWRQGRNTWGGWGAWAGTGGYECGRWRERIDYLSLSHAISARTRDPSQHPLACALPLCTRRLPERNSPRRE